MKKTTLLLLTALLSAAVLPARGQSVPPLINYQGQLLDAVGNPMPTGDYDVEIRLFPVESGGALVWGPQTFNGQSGTGLGPKVSVVQGHFNLVLGPKDTADRNLLDIVAANPSLFLEIKIGTGSPIAPRQQLLTAPYALGAANAANAAKLNGFDWSAVFAGGNPQTGNVGLGVPPSGQKLEVNGRARMHKGNEGSAGIWFNHNGSDRAFVGMLDDNIVGFYSPLGAGWTLRVNGITGEAIAPAMNVSGSLSSYNASVTDTLTVGSVSMWTSTVFGTFNVAGVNDFQFYGKVWANSYATFSDERLKENIETLQTPLEKIQAIRAVTYNFKEHTAIPNLDPTPRHIGVLAQDVEKVLPEAVTAGPDGYLGVNYDALVPVLVEAMKEQQKQIKALQAEVAGLKRATR